MMHALPILPKAERVRQHSGFGYAQQKVEIAESRGALTFVGSSITSMPGSGDGLVASL
jgi:hypothetical protein